MDMYPFTLLNHLNMNTDFIKDYPNVFYDENSAIELNFLDVREYIFEITHNLKIKLGKSFEDYLFIYFSTNSDGRIPASAGQKFSHKRKVLFYLLDEACDTVDNLSNDYFCIFKQYLPYENGNNVYSFPLGHVNGIRFKKNQIKPSRVRTLDTFFSGSLNKNRSDFFNQFSSIKVPSTRVVSKMLKLPYFKKAKQYIKKTLNKYNNMDQQTLQGHNYIKFTDGFKQGLSRVDYMQYLLNSKIAFCPSGASSVESYRHYEALSGGCVVISENLPKTSIYDNSPFIQIRNWKEGIEIAKDLLGDLNELERLQKLSLKFWLDHYSPQAVADYIVKKIQSLQ